MQLLQDGQGLLLGAVLQNPLDHPAAVWVGGQHEYLPTNHSGEFEYLVLPRDRLTVMICDTLTKATIYLLESVEVGGLPEQRTCI